MQLSQNKFSLDDYPGTVRFFRTENWPSGVKSGWYFALHDGGWQGPYQTHEQALQAAEKSVPAHLK